MKYSKFVLVLHDFRNHRTGTDSFVTMCKKGNVEIVHE